MPELECKKREKKSGTSKGSALDKDCDEALRSAANQARTEARDRAIDAAFDDSCPAKCPYRKIVFKFKRPEVETTMNEETKICEAEATASWESSVECVGDWNQFDEPLGENGTPQKPARIDCGRKARYIGSGGCDWEDDTAAKAIAGAEKRAAEDVQAQVQDALKRARCRKKCPSARIDVSVSIPAHSEPKALKSGSFRCHAWCDWELVISCHG
jgi:hypothetical protein